MISTKALNQLNSFVLVFSFFSLWLSVFMDDQTESALSYVLILSIGIIHGANDLKLINDTNTNFIKRLSLYIVVVLLTAIVFFQFLPIATALFIFLSAYHFGEQHWNIRIKLSNRFAYFYYAIYGLLIFSLLFGLNHLESILIIEDLTGIELQSSHFITIAIISGVIWMGMTAILVIRKQGTLFFWLQELFFLAVLALIFKTATLIWAFTIYFIIWHSLPSLLSQLYYLYGIATKKSVLQYVKSSFVYWVGAILFLTALFYFLKDYMDMFLSILVAFLAAITLPHSLVMTKMFRSTKRN